jgi:nitrate reductase alpha subunit
MFLLKTASWSGKPSVSITLIQAPIFPITNRAAAPRGASFSRYIYSPLRVKYPYIRFTLLEAWKEALASHPDPVTAWGSIMTDETKSRNYRKVRGKGGLVRVSWDEGATLIIRGSGPHN